MRLERIKPVLWALLVTALLGAAIVVGSRNLSRFDAALVAYTFASLFAAFGLTYRYAMWLQRPPTALYLAAGMGGLFQAALPKAARGQLVQAGGGGFRAESVYLVARKIPMASPLADHVGVRPGGGDHLSAGIWLAHVRIGARRPG